MKKRTEKLTNAELSGFCGQVALMLNAGMVLYDGMETLAENSRDGEYAELYAAVSRGVNETGSLYQALKGDGRWPGYLVEMVGIGETTGHLEEVMNSLSAFYEREERIRESVISAVTYPLVLGAMLLVIVFVMMVKVLPVFNHVLGSMGVSVNENGSALMRVGGMIGLVVMLVVGLLLLAVLVIVILMQTGLRDKTMNFLCAVFPPMRRLRRKLSAARVASVLSMMLSGGFPMDEALRMAPSILDDAESVRKVEDMRSRVENGESFGDAVSASGLFDGLHTRMIRMGASAGKEDIVMAKVASIYEEQTEDDISRLVSIIEPTLVALLAVVIGAVLLTVMLPMTGILSGIL